MRLEFHPAAALELSEAAQYYETRLAGLGRDLNVEARRVGAVVCETPRIGKPVDTVHRRMSFHRFPLAFIYRIDGAAVRVMAVAHWRRLPGYWRSRK
jgi:toxin ParE1/3/4